MNKREMQSLIDEMQDDLRRMNRALNQAHLDLSTDGPSSFAEITPSISEQSIDAIKRAQSEWASVVKEPQQRIDTYIRSAQGLSWSWEEPYTRNGQFAWCGAFAAFAYTAARLQIRKKIFPSCYRLYNAWANTSRHISADQVRPGDIVVVYTSKRATWGDHITLCVDASSYSTDGYITTIEGNANGKLGDGSKGEGVITRQRPAEQIAHVYRLLSEDFDE